MFTFAVVTLGIFADGVVISQSVLIGIGDLYFGCGSRFVWGVSAFSCRDEPSWLKEQRLAAWKTFCMQDLPHQKEEEWMRTDIRAFQLDAYGLPAKKGSGTNSAKHPRGRAGYWYLTPIFRPTESDSHYAKIGSTTCAGSTPVSLMSRP